MSDMHPHWNSTDDSKPSSKPVQPIVERSVPVTEKKQEVATVSRRPAAVVGILLVVGMGFGFFKGVESLRGQLSPTVQIHITETGFNPDIAKVDYDQNIVWTNDTDEPQHIISGTICESEETADCLSLGPIPPRGSAVFKIGRTIEDAIYSYSRVSDGVHGQIALGIAQELLDDEDEEEAPESSTPEPVVEESAFDNSEAFEDASSASSSSVNEGLEELQQLQDEMDSSSSVAAIADNFEETDNEEENFDELENLEALEEEFTDDTLDSNYFTDTLEIPEEAPSTIEPIAEVVNDPVIPTVPQANIPTNPYTATSGQSYVYAGTANNLHSGAPAPITQTHQPIRQPETGASVWIVALLSMIGIYWYTRSAFGGSKVVIRK